MSLTHRVFSTDERLGIPEMLEAIRREAAENGKLWSPFPGKDRLRTKECRLVHPGEMVAIIDSIQPRDNGAYMRACIDGVMPHKVLHSQFFGEFPYRIPNPPQPADDDYQDLSGHFLMQNLYAFQPGTIAYSIAFNHSWEGWDVSCFMCLNDPHDGRWQEWFAPILTAPVRPREGCNCVELPGLERHLHLHA